MISRDFLSKRVLKVKRTEKKTINCFMRLPLQRHKVDYLKLKYPFSETLPLKFAVKKFCENKALLTLIFENYHI